MAKAKKIHVGELRVGMHVSKLDREWLDTPFLMQGFLIEDPEDIDIVAEYCEHVWVDTQHGKRGSAYSSDVGTASFAPINTLLNETPIQEEHKKAYKAFRQARSLTKTLLDDIRLGKAIDTEGAKDTVNECVKSVLRHPDAMMWMAKIREESEYTAEHCLNVCILAVAFGRHLGMEEADLQNLGLCGLLHDIGKMRVPMSIIDKPGRLTDKEMSLMKAHTVHGRNLLVSAAGVYSGTIDVAYSHHERMDGKGYPRKLPGSGISKFSRIISIVDAYDAMTATRCYSRAKSSTEALKIIYQERGKQFDDELALQFIKTIGLFPAGSIVELYSGEIGLVIEINQRMRHLPKVILILDENHEPRKKEKVLDLSFIESGELPRKYLVKHVWPDGAFDIYLREFQQKGLVIKR